MEKLDTKGRKWLIKQAKKDILELSEMRRQNEEEKWGHEKGLSEIRKQNKWWKAEETMNDDEKQRKQNEETEKINEETGKTESIMGSQKIEWMMRNRENRIKDEKEKAENRMNDEKQRKQNELWEIEIRKQNEEARWNDEKDRIKKRREDCTCRGNWRKGKKKTKENKVIGTREG